MAMDLLFALKWVKSVIGRALYIFHLSGLSQKVVPSIEQNIGMVCDFTNGHLAISKVKTEVSEKILSTLILYPIDGCTFLRVVKSRLLLGTKHVTRLGNLFDFGQLFKAFGSI